MALITPVSPSVDASTAQFAPQITGMMAGEDLLAGAPCYIKASDNLVYMSNGTGTTEVSHCHGFTPRATKAGQPVTLYGPGTRFHYAAGTMTPGTRLYVGATAGRLDAAATAGDDVGVAFAISSHDIVVAGYH